MKIVILFGALVFTLPGFSQTKDTSNEAIPVLEKIEARLNSFTKLSYRYTMETWYYDDNYHFVRNAGIYIERVANSPIGLRFQAKDGKKFFIYDGSLTLRIDDSTMTIDSASAETAAKMQNNSYLYHSLAMLRNIIPVIIGNDSIQKQLRDTLIGGRGFLCIDIEGPGMYFGLFAGILHIGVADLRRPYVLIVDPNTFFPFQFIARYIRGNDQRDFVSVTYADINTSPAAPAPTSWHYAAYADHYRPYKHTEKPPLVKEGAVVADFTLPVYSPERVDSISLHQYAGKVVLLDFWFKSCGPCMVAMPHYNALQQRYGKDGFQLLTINIEDGPDDMKFFYRKFSPSYKMLFRGGELFQRLGLPGCPSALLLDQRGKISRVFVGFSQTAIEKEIRKALGQ